MAKLRKQGIFYLLENDEAQRLAAALDLKLIERTAQLWIRVVKNSWD